MPSVEMRRSTRVFVPKAKDGELVRVLRSGRRLWVESAEVKDRESKNEDEWFPSTDDSRKCKKQQINKWLEVGPKAEPMDIDEVKPVRESASALCRFADESKSEDRMFKNVYCRKRKRLDVRNLGGLFISASGEDCQGRKFGLHFVRRRRRRIGCNYAEKNWEDEIEGFNDHGLVSIIVESSCARCCLFSRVLCSLLRYISEERVGLAELSVFLLSSPISPVFASCGIHFLWNRPCIKSRGLCKIFGARLSIPLFTVDFSAVPLCFLRLHASLSFRAVHLSCLCWMDFHWNNEFTDIDEPLQYIINQSESSISRLMASDKDDLKDTKSVNLTSGASKFCNRNVQHRSGVITRSGSKRRRRSLRNRRARNPSHFVLQKANGPPVSHNVIPKKNIPLLAVARNQEVRRSVRKSSVSEMNVPKSGSLALNVEAESLCCSTNILVVEIDKGYRVEGAEIMLDVSVANEWVLAVKKDGSMIYCLKVQREMRPGATNRFTHAVIWAAENGWKLEFPDRKDWAVFKELYKVCLERNAIPTSPVVKIIPVPGVCEVTNSWDSTSTPFERPDSYIRTTSDELSRALSRRTANYDMDSEDEVWLSKFNNESIATNHLSEEAFELMIDVFEKASHCSSEDVNDEKPDAGLCLHLASLEVGESVCRYWMKRRKQKRAPLIRVFQLNQLKRAQLIKKPVLRKKRSLKRPAIHPVQRGRGKNSIVLEAIAAERNAVEEKSVMLRVQEAKASADRSVELAILKRQRAQFLMENADLAVYRATMALRIADAAVEVEDSHQAAAHFLD